MKLLVVVFLGFFFFMGCGEDDSTVNDYCSKSCEHEMNCGEYFFEDYKSLSECKDLCNIWTPANVEYYYYLSDKCGSALEDYLKCYSKNINVKNCSNYDYEDENEVCLTEMLLVEVHCDDDDDFDDDSCTDGEKKCADTTFMWCTSGIWITQDCEDSGKVCNETKGCVSADLDNL